MVVLLAAAAWRLTCITRQKPARSRTGHLLPCASASWLDPQRLPCPAGRELEAGSCGRLDRSAGDPASEVRHPVPALDGMDSPLQGVRPARTLRTVRPHLAQPHARTQADGRFHRPAHAPQRRRQRPRPGLDNARPLTRLAAWRERGRLRPPASLAFPGVRSPHAAGRNHHRRGPERPRRRAPPSPLPPRELQRAQGRNRRTRWQPRPCDRPLRQRRQPSRPTRRTT